MTPFNEGYTQALRDSLPEDQRNAPLAPETVQRIVEDCAAFSDMLQSDYSSAQVRRMARDFWRARNGEEPVRVFAEFSGWRKLVERSRTFPPLTPYLDDDGKVYLRPTGASL